MVALHQTCRRRLGGTSVCYGGSIGKKCVGSSSKRANFKGHCMHGMFCLTGLSSITHSCSGANSPSASSLLGIHHGRLAAPAACGGSLSPRLRYSWRIGHLCCVHKRAVLGICGCSTFLPRAPPHHKASGGELPGVDDHSCCQGGHKCNHKAHSPEGAGCVAPGERLLGGGIAVGVMQVEDPTKVGGAGGSAGQCVDQRLHGTTNLQGQQRFSAWPALSSARCRSVPSCPTAHCPARLRRPLAWSATSTEQLARQEMLWMESENSALWPVPSR